MSTLKIPVVYSPAHETHAPAVEFWNGRLIPHFENALRIELIMQHLLETDLITLIEPQEPISLDKITAVHVPGMVEHLIETSEQAEAILEVEDQYYGDDHHQENRHYVYPSLFSTRPGMGKLRESLTGRQGFYAVDMVSPIGQGTWPASHIAASIAYQSAQLLINGDTHIAYALCRPPGHHAGPDFFGGYCYLNNAAIAARALTEMGKVAIIDIDYHHGNGTQSCFWDEPQVFFGSIHADSTTQYPYYSGYADEIGGSKASGSNANIPVAQGCTEDEYLQVFSELLDRTLSFEPKVIVISLGYDTYEKDPLGSFKLTPESYHRLALTLAGLDIPLLLIQEGGYHIDSLGMLAEHFVKGLLPSCSSILETDGLPHVE